MCECECARSKIAFSLSLVYLIVVCLVTKARKTTSRLYVCAVIVMCVHVHSTVAFAVLVHFDSIIMGHQCKCFLFVFTRFSINIASERQTSERHVFGCLLTQFE